MKHRNVTRIATLGVLSLVFSCVFGATTASARTTLVPIRYVVSHQNVLLGTLPQFVAQDKGFFRKNGVDIHFLSGGGGGTTLRLLSTGDVDMAEGGLSAAILAAKTDPDHIELVGDWYHSASVLVWMAPSNTKIHAVHDLKGAKLGYSAAGSASQRLALMAIRAAGVKDVQLVAVGGMGNNWAAARAGVITAGWAMEPFLSTKIQQDGAKVVLDPGKYVHHFYLEGIDVNKQFAAKHPDAVSGVFEALAQAVGFIREHPDEATEIAAKHYKASKSVLKAGIAQYIKEGVWDMKTDPKAFDTVIEDMVQSGQLSHPVDIGKLLNQKYLPARFRTEIK